MKAMVLRAPWELVLDEVARPPLSENHVLVHVTHSGICGTDFKIYSGAIPVNYPRIMGHEMAGEVVSVASGSGSVASGFSRTSADAVSGQAGLRTGLLLTPDTPLMFPKSGLETCWRFPSAG
jgi:D-arabinose 1-dehydrogenase-like Zn-dependent alcohol dehydrogenase